MSSVQVKVRADSPITVNVRLTTISFVKGLRTLLTLCRKAIFGREISADFALGGEKIIKAFALRFSDVLKGLMPEKQDFALNMPIDVSRRRKLTPTFSDQTPTTNQVKNHGFSLRCQKSILGLLKLFANPGLG